MSIIMRDVEKIPAKKGKPGIIEKVTLAPEEMLGKCAKLTHLVVDVGKSIESNAKNEETIYYVLAGHAYLSVNLPNGTWERELPTDSAAWIPSGFSHNLTSSGEGPLRILKATCTV